MDKKAKGMGLKGRELVEQNYTLQIQAPKLAQLFQDITGNKKIEH